MNRRAIQDVVAQIRRIAGNNNPDTHLAWADALDAALADTESGRITGWRKDGERIVYTVETSYGESIEFVRREDAAIAEPGEATLIDAIGFYGAACVHYGRASATHEVGSPELKAAWSRLEETRAAANTLAHPPAQPATLFDAARLPPPDEHGFFFHPDIYAIFGDDECDQDESVRRIAVRGWECAYVSGDELVNEETGEYTARGWTPESPRGDGWRLVGIYDTEDGPYAMFVRPAQPAASAEPAVAWLPDEGAYLIRFDDADRSDELFTGSSARDCALRRYEQISVSWNAHLFVKIDSNSRDVQTPSAHPPAQPAVPDGYTAVRTDTLRWLLGERGDFECPPDQYRRGKPAPYFWRTQLRAAMLGGDPQSSAIADALRKNEMLKGGSR